jgi:molybdate transport system substrate-binding protein
MPDSIELKVMTSNALRSVFAELLPAFERAQGIKIAATYDPAKRVQMRIAAGETADVAVSNTPAIERMIDEGVLDAASRRDFAHYGIGIAVKAGAAKPDISTVDAFKRTLLSARAIACTIDGTSGMYFSQLIERLGIADAINAKASRQPGGLSAEQLIDGRADIAVQQVPELLAAGKGIELAGLLPAELQKMSVLAAGVFKSSACADAGRTFIDFLATLEASRSFKAAGFDPL